MFRRERRDGEDGTFVLALCGGGSVAGCELAMDHSRERRSEMTENTMVPTAIPI